jgi:predicted GNAT family acetyltransferase
VVITAGPTGAPPDGWATEFSGDGVQMTGEDVVADGGTTRDRPRVGALGADDVEDMLALVALSRPGPFTRRTWELGGYVGVRERGRLVAMAGERMHPEGWGEISAVATHPDHRRRGLGELVVRAVAAGIIGRGDVPVLHAAAVNTGAIRLYRAMGFTVRRTIRFQAVRAPS